MALPTNRIKNPLDIDFNKFGRSIFQQMFPDEFPRVDVSSTDDSICVKAELSGMTKDDVSVEINDFILEIKGEKKEETIEEDETFYVKEMRSGSFERSFQLPTDIDPENVEASFKDGILTINIPRTGEEKPHKVNIK